MGLCARGPEPGGEKDPARQSRCICGDWFSVEFCERIDAGGMRVTGSIPVLACPTCKRTMVPSGMEDPIGKAVQEARENGQKECEFFPKERRFGLCEGAGFVYCSADREIIAGLEEAGKAEGHYVPVFFDGDVLSWYRQNGEYAIETTRHHKRIRFPGGASLDYGVNRHGRVFCWLGDLDAIPREEQERMRAHNVESDHDVISGMYKEDRLGLDLEGTAEERLKGAIYELAEASRARAGFAIHRLEYEDRRIAERLERPREWHRDITQAIVDLERVCVETIDAGALRGSLRKPDDEVKGLKGLKILEAWIGVKLPMREAPAMMPFFVLNDWRNYLVHRDGDGSLLKALKAGRVHLGMGEDDDDDSRMYGLLLEALTASCLALAAGVESTLGGDGSRRVPGLSRTKQGAADSRV